jgi:beta-galactosidase
MLPPGEENPLIFKGAFPTTHMHAARIWADIVEPKSCQVLATYAKDFYSGRPALTINNYGMGKAVYIATMPPQNFYNDLVVWLRQMCHLTPLLKVPENIEVSMREKDDSKIFFLLNHQSSSVRVQFYKPMHEFLTATSFSGSHDIPAHGVLVLDERKDIHHEPAAAHAET